MFPTSLKRLKSMERKREEGYKGYNKALGENANNNESMQEFSALSLKLFCPFEIYI